MASSLCITLFDPYKFFLEVGQVISISSKGLV